MDKLAFGLYEALLDEGLVASMQAHPELRPLLDKLQSDEEPSRYAAHIARIVEQILKSESKSKTRQEICNRLIELLANERPEYQHLRLAISTNDVLLEVTPPRYAIQGIARPQTSLAESSLFTGSPSEPQLAHELQQEMPSADSVDILVSFIKWSGLRLLADALAELTSRGGYVRVITTSYMGASDAPAIEWLARLPNTSVRVSYDVSRTRLHAKAYHFLRKTGFSTAYIGSANMSHPAMTGGLEWNLKVTEQDLPHVIEKFRAEFETYWNSREFLPFDPAHPEQLRQALAYARQAPTFAPVFFDLRPHPYQERVLDALETEREQHGLFRNLIVAATGTGKTVIASFDFQRYFEKKQRRANLLYVAHRSEILKQALATFRQVLRSESFGQLLVGDNQPDRFDHLFCSVEMLRSRRLWESVGTGFYDFIIVDEVHHAPASSYRAIFESFQPEILLGLTATPERMDGQNVLSDFGNRIAAEIRLPEALEEKLLCPFQYFAVADPVSLNDDNYWKNGRYDVTALSNVYTGGSVAARRRVEVVVTALTRYEPDLGRVRGIGFCATVSHAELMAKEFNARGIASAVLVGSTDQSEREKRLEDLREGRLTFLFTRDVLNEGLDIPEVNTVLFLRPTESLTVFLQQLGRGLRHAPEKDCLTVLDLVGQVHRRYRVDAKFRALLPAARFSIEREIELNFPHLPAGCSIQLDPVAKENVLRNIRDNLRGLSDYVLERIRTFEDETNQELSFGAFVRSFSYDPGDLLRRHSWHEWKARAGVATPASDPDRDQLKAGILRLATVTGPREIKRLREVARKLLDGDIDGAVSSSIATELMVHYRAWGRPGTDLGLPSFRDSLERLSSNPEFLRDLDEVLEWASSESRVLPRPVVLPFPCALELHAQYSFDVAKAALGKATLESAGERGVGLVYVKELKCYSLFITFKKEAREFSPSTMYADYPISRELMHWESPSTTTQAQPTGRHLINHRSHGITILLFARTRKKESGSSVPYTYLGPGEVEQFESNRPIRVIWRLTHPMPAEMFEENRRGG